MDGEAAADGKRKAVQVPRDMEVELGPLNDMALTDEEMLFHIRQFIASLAKKVKEQNKEAKETRIKCEGAVKKAETQESKVNGTRQTIVDITEKFRHFEENMLAIDGKLTKRNNNNSDEIAGLKKEAKHI